MKIKPVLYPLFFCGLNGCLIQQVEPSIGRQDGATVPSQSGRSAVPPIPVPASADAASPTPLPPQSNSDECTTGAIFAPSDSRLDAHVDEAQSLVANAGTTLSLPVRSRQRAVTIAVENPSRASVMNSTVVRILRPGPVRVSFSDGLYTGFGLLAGLDGKSVSRELPPPGYKYLVPTGAELEKEGYVLIRNVHQFARFRQLYLRSEFGNEAPNNESVTLNNGETIVAVGVGINAGEREPIVSNVSECKPEIVNVIIPDAPSGPRPSTSKLTLNVYRIKRNIDEIQVALHRVSSVKLLSEVKPNWTE